MIERIKHASLSLKIASGGSSRRIFIDMLHLYGTRGEYQDLGENNFSVCEEVQHNRVFVAEGRRGAKNASIYALSGHERIEKPSDQ